VSHEEKTDWDEKEREVLNIAERKEDHEERKSGEF
jgi:hypothetical protein